MNKTVGVFVLRVILALIFVMQGYGKVVTYGVGKVYEMFFMESFAATILPDLLVKATAYYTSWVELLAGFLLLIGLFRNIALYALASVLIIVTFGHGLIEPIWNMHHVIYRTVLLVPLLLLPEEWDTWSLDRLIRIKKNE